MFEFILLPFMQRALIAGILVGFLASYYGVFVVQRGLGFLGSGLAHAAFGGVALGILLDQEPLLIAVPFTVLVAIGITYVKNKTNLAGDTTIGIFFSVSIIFLDGQPKLSNIFYYGTVFNIFLFCFNLLPIPPLDGSHILFSVFPNKFTAQWMSLGLYGSFILLFFIFSPLWKYFLMLINSILSLFLIFAGIK